MQVARVVTLGASNLTRGFQTVVSTGRQAWGPGVEVLAALGHGRSYGAPSRLLVRSLPGILDCGLWRELERRQPARTRALVTDIGNDILYGFSADQILAWVDDAVCRLRRFTDDLIITDLPLESMRRLSKAKFLLFRSVLVPSCRLSMAEALERAERVNEGLFDLAAAHSARLFRLRSDWYGFDPIHIRPSLWRAAWREILGISVGVDEDRQHWVEGAKLYLMRPERRWLFGIEQSTPQSGRRLALGGRVWLY